MTPQRYEGRCSDCNAVVWESLGSPRRPHYREQVVCSSCGTDNSTPPTFAQRMRHGLRALKRRARVYGWPHAIHMGIADAFRLERERKQADDGNRTDNGQEANHDPVFYPPPIARDDARAPACVDPAESPQSSAAASAGV